MAQFTYIDRRNPSQPVLRLCVKGISRSATDSDCPVIFPAAAVNVGKRMDAQLDVFRNAQNAIEKVTLEPFISLRKDGLPVQGSVELSPVCLNALKWPFHQ